MKKTTLSTICFLLIALGCSDNSPKTTILVAIVENGGIPVSGASVELYNSVQQWVSGGTPVLKGTTDATGSLKSTQQLTGALYVYAEKGTKNNWPDIFGSLPFTTGPDGVSSGGAGIVESLLADVKSASTKNYLLTDVKNSSGVSIFANVAACSKDNFIKIGIDLKMTINEGSNVCSGQSPQTFFDYFAQSKDVQTTHGGFTVYPWSVTGQPIIMFVTTDFTKIILSQSGTDSIYTRQ